MRMKLRAQPDTPPEPSQGILRRRISRWNRLPDPELAAAVHAPPAPGQDFGAAVISASPMQTDVAVSVLRIGDAIALLESAPHHASGDSVASGRERLRAFLAGNGLERLDVRRDGLIDRALAARVPTETLLHLGAIEPVEDHDEGLWLEAAQVWSAPNLTAVEPPDGGDSFPFWKAALRGEIRAGDLLTVQDSAMGIRRPTAFIVYTALCRLKDGTLPYTAETLRALVAVAGDADEFLRGEEMITEYGGVIGGDRGLAAYPFARGRTVDEFASVADYAKKVGRRANRDEWGLVVALHDAGYPAEDLLQRIRGGATLRAVAAEVLDGVPPPLSEGWL